MDILPAISLLIYLPYLFFFVRVWAKWRKLPVADTPASPLQQFSIIIPARNEAQTLPYLLDDLKHLDYPKNLFEVIVVDDDSEDKTAAIAKNEGLHVIRMGERPIAKAHKKAALSAGIAAAKYPYIITTDADCRVQPQWLKAINDYLSQTKADIVAAPVLIHSPKNLLQKVLALEAAGMAVITGAMIRSKWLHLSNGANIIFKKSAFEAVGGYTGIDHVASGDDMLLMSKMKKRFEVGFIKDARAVVFTEAPSTLSQLLHQRVRWVGKFSKAATPVTAAFVLIYLLHLLLPVFVIVAFFEPVFWLWSFLLLLLLAMPLYITIRRGEKSFFQHRKRSNFQLPTSSFAFAFFFYTLYILLIGPISLFLKPEWKGRKV